jgi:hypothetical protein
MMSQVLIRYRVHDYSGDGRALGTEDGDLARVFWYLGKQVDSALFQYYTGKAKGYQFSKWEPKSKIIKPISLEAALAKVYPVDRDKRDTVRKDVERLNRQVNKA